MNNRKNHEKEDIDGLFRIILRLNNVAEARKFFRDLLTENELSEFAQRWKAAKMLSEGKAYLDIEKETRMSSATIARVRRWLNNGMGGYKLMIKKQKYETRNFNKKQ